MLQVILTGFWLGLVFNAAPGPVFTESLRRGVRGGFRPALAVQVGSLVGDAAWAVLGLAGAAALLTQPQWHIPITLAGCLVLLFLGGQGLYAAWRPPATEDPAAQSAGSAMRGPLVAGALMSLGSVWNVVYWGGAGGAVGGALGEEAAMSALLVFFAAFMASSILWCFICAGFIAGLRRAMSQRWTRVIEGGAGAALIVMAVLLAIQAFD
ncbi:LysE family transporter [Nesterenkonia sp. MY13]|uniref:LysE family transporter n=1 Tax=Nesterenkonia sedimenti TaxID=1463632 RepID=A0A7X8TL08_9MICC|nr:LysE family transporter [Nesterenkonia sedimenti]NLS10514.1 LysE family transporter [Nesterenkonia sedimenti]